MELRDQLKAVENELEAENQKGAQKDADVIAQLEERQAQLLEAIMNEEQAQAQQVRIQTQEEKVESITLPFDFDDIFENAKANEMIIEVVKEFQRKSYEDHNAEIQALTDAHKEEIRASGEREVQLKRQNEELQGSLNTANHANQDLNQNYAKLESKMIELESERDDAFAKRDAAVRELEEAQTQIEQLKQWNEDQRIQLEFGVRKAISIIDISPTEKLAQMVKETAAEKANRALDRWKDVIEVMPVAVDPPIAPAGEATFQPGDTQTDDTAHQLDETGPIPIPTDHQEVAAPAVQFQGEVQVAHGVSSENGQGGETVSRQEFETLKADVEQLKATANKWVA